MYLTLLKGFASSASLIIAIGAQNTFVIRQGLLKNQLFLTALLCSLIDALLIIVGVLGFGQLVSAYPLFVRFMKYFAILFLSVYGSFAFKSALKRRSLEHGMLPTRPSRKKTVILLLAFSLLNPHVYLDTVILLGSIASQQPLNEQIYFAFGAVSASFVWFFGLCYGSRFLAPFLSHPASWKVIDLLTAFTMWAIAISLVMTL